MVKFRRQQLNWLGLIAAACVVVGILAAASANPDFYFTFGMTAKPAAASTQGYGFATYLGDLSPSDLNQRLDALKATGATWVRYDVSWQTVQPQSASGYDWSDTDRVMKAARVHGFQVLTIIDFTPSWARAAGCNAGQFCAPADPKAYGRFAGMVAKRYRPMGVSDYEIWNEPNTSARFAPAANPELYARMVRDADAAIRRNEPQATVITGGTAPSATGGGNYSPLDFVSALYADGAGGWFDAVGAHPYLYPLTPSQSQSTDAWGQLAAIHRVMATHGDASKQIWVTEFGAPTDGPSGHDHVSEEAQAASVTEAVSLLRAHSWAGPLFWYDYQDTGTDTSTNENFFGLVRADGSQKPAYAAFVQAVAKR